MDSVSSAASSATSGLSSAASAAAPALASAAGAVAGTAANDMYDESCVMCEYILEQVDKMIKAQPRLMQGNGFYPGTMDFGGGVQQGNYRVYQGTYLEESEHRRQRQSSATAKASTQTESETSRKKGAASRRKVSPKGKVAAAPAWYGRSRCGRNHVERRRNPLSSERAARSRFDAIFLESFTERQHQRKQRELGGKARQSSPANHANSQLPRTERQGAALTRFQQLVAKSQAMSGAQARVQGKMFDAKMGVLSARAQSRARKGGKGGDDLISNAATAVKKGATAAANAVVSGVKAAATTVKNAIVGKPGTAGGQAGAGSIKQPIQAIH